MEPADEPAPRYASRGLPGAAGGAVPLAQRICHVLHGEVARAEAHLKSGDYTAGHPMGLGDRFRRTGLRDHPGLAAVVARADSAVLEASSLCRRWADLDRSVASAGEGTEAKAELEGLRDEAGARVREHLEGTLLPTLRRCIEDALAFAAPRP